MSDKKGIADGPRQFKQTKLTFGLAFQSSSSHSPPQQQRKRPKLSEDDSIASDPNDTDIKDPVAAESSKEAKNAEKDTSPAQEAPEQSSTVGEAGEAQAQATPDGQLRITERVGDIFNAPPRSILIHACNAMFVRPELLSESQSRADTSKSGSWGAGIAAAFRERYPDAYRIYNAHCKRSLPQRLIGTALLIAPRDGTRRQHYVGCLFTSKWHGRNKDSPADILRATEPALRDLIHQILAEMASGEHIGEVRICHINSGLFAVPWGQSKAVIESLRVNEEDIPDGVRFSRDIIAYSPN